MALRGKKPKEIEQRLKMLLYGNAKVGKTSLALQFPKPYIIDTEDGATKSKYVKIIDKSDGVIFQTTNFDDLFQEVVSLSTIKHDYKTLIIDSLTIIYADMLDKQSIKLAAAAKNPDSDGTEFGKHKMIPDMRMKRLYNWLSRLDMNIIIISQAKMKWEKEQQVGTTFDCYTRSDYVFDLILELEKRGENKDAPRYAKVKGTRYEDSEFMDGESFEIPKDSYNVFYKRLGHSVLEREVKVIDLATKDQIEEINRLLEMVSIPEKTISSWHNKEKADTFNEFSSENIQKCIEYIKSQVINPQGEAA